MAPKHSKPMTQAEEQAEDKENNLKFIRDGKSPVCYRLSALCAPARTFLDRIRTYPSISAVRRSRVRKNHPLASKADDNYETRNQISEIINKSRGRTESPNSPSTNTPVHPSRSHTFTAYTTLRHMAKIRNPEQICFHNHANTTTVLTTSSQE